LPDNWCVSRPHSTGVAWYRVRFAVASTPTSAYGVYAPKAALNGAFYANGIYVGSGGSFERGSMGRNFNRAQFYVIPAALIHVGENSILVRLWASGGACQGLGRMTIGPEQSVRPIFEHRFLVQTELPELAAAADGLIGLLLIFLWLQRRRDTVYGYLGMAILAGILFVATLLVRDPLVPGYRWDAVGISAMTWFSAFGCLFALRFAGLGWPRIERALWVLVVVALPIGVLGSPDTFRIVIAFQVLLCVPLLLIAGGLLTTHWWRVRTWESALLLSSYAVTMLASAHDAAFFAGAIPFESMFWTPYGAAVGSVINGGVLIGRFVRHLNEYERLNRELEGRVAEKHAQLQTHYERVRRLERDNAVIEERQRIMRDMHDGLGSQLISALSQVERGQLDRQGLMALLRECMDDLRLTVDSLDAAGRDLLAVLGTFRYRLEPRLRASDIRLDWRVSEIPQLSCLTQRNILQILRVL